MSNKNNTFYLNKLKKGNLRRTLTILIVENDNNVAKMFAEILIKRGHMVTIANKATTCICECQACSYDVIFMDFHLEDINGAETTDLLRSVCLVKSLIFAFTGDDSKESLKLFKEFGMDGAIIKPLNIDLISKFMNSLELRNELDKRSIKGIHDSKKKTQLFIFE
jgi:DNA-binding response OmpR family regulator